MTFKRVIFAATLCGVLMTSCNKEPQGMLLVAEGFDNGGKAAVAGERSYWVNGETVRINGTNYSVIVSEGRAYADNVAEAAEYRALYPDTLASDAALDNNNVTVTIPRIYTYRVSNGHQLLGVPMAAYGTSGSQLSFKHLTAAVTVQVTNNFGIDINIDSIIVSSPSYQLSGSRSITLGADMTVEPCTTATAADRRVAVCFNGSTALKVNSGATAEVQVSVLPVGSDNKFTVTVKVHNADEATMQYTFSRTQTTGGSLLRAQLGYAPASFGGVFSVSASQKVRFSSGNLQYLPVEDKWRFALHQYDTAVFNIDYYTTSSNEWIDLFGFGTSGEYQLPYYHIPDESKYYHDGNITANEYDWGWHNYISNGGNSNHIWRTLTKDEWKYVAVDHPENIIRGRIEVETSKYRNGLIILCDNFQRPANITYTTGTNKSFSNNTFTLEKWRKMEVAGAIFLPLIRHRDNTRKVDKYYAYYWSSTLNTNNNPATTAYELRFGDQYDGLSMESTYLFYGQCVRLVRDVASN